MRNTAADKELPLPKGNAGGLAALIIGIVFVVISGLLFATTTWNVLPNTSKVLGVLLFSVCFFVICAMSEYRLHIHKTGNAFYLLGCIFLFLSVLDAGYFRIFGPAFILEGMNRWRVLWVGSLVTEAVLFAGIKRFLERAYTQVCFWGLSVSMTFPAVSVPMSRQGFMASMMIYAAMLVIVFALLEKRENTSKFLESGRIFVPAHFILFLSVYALMKGMRFGYTKGRMTAETASGTGTGVMTDAVAGCRENAARQKGFLYASGCYACLRA